MRVILQCVLTATLSLGTLIVELYPSHAQSLRGLVTIECVVHTVNSVLWFREAGWRYSQCAKLLWEGCAKFGWY